MGVFISNSITDRGRILLGDAQVGAVFEATRIVMGSGHIPSGFTAATMTNVVAPVIELGINKKKRAGDGTVTFGGVYSNENITEAFYFREFALFARVQYADGTYSDEVLYSYGNAGNNADLMPAYSTSAIVEKQMDLVTWVGNETQVNLTIESGMYIPINEKGAPGGVAMLDENGSADLSGGVSVSNGIGTVGANSNMAVLAHHSVKGGLARYIAISKENSLENALFMNEELEDGGAVSYAIPHTGMENPAGAIGAFPATKLLTGSPNANALTTEGNYFLLNGRNIPATHGFVSVQHFDGNSFAPDLAWGRTHCIRQVFRDFSTTMICERVGLLKSEASNTWEWSEWDEVPTTSKNIVLNVPTNRGYRIKNIDTGAASDFMAGGGYSVMRIMDTFDDKNNYREVMLVGANGSPGIAHAVRFLDVVNGVGTAYSFYHEGNAPAITATAELI